MTDTPSNPGGEGSDPQPSGQPPLPPPPPPFQPQGQPQAPQGPPPAAPYPPQGQPYPPQGQPYQPQGQPYQPQGQPYPPQGQAPYPPAGGFQAAPPPQFGEQPLFGSVAKPPIPSAVTNAVKLMYAGAALSAIGLIVGLLSTSTIRHAVRKKYPNDTTSKINTIVHAEVAGLVIVGLIGIGLWLWIAWKLKAGRQWARVTGTVFFGLDTLALLGTVGGSTGAGSKILGIISWLVGLAIVILIWRRESSAYFKPKPQPESSW